VFSKEPQIARLDVDVRLVGDRRDLVRVPDGRSADAVLVGEFRQHPGEGRVAGLDLGQERRQRVLLGDRHRGQWIEAGEHQALLRLAELDVGHRHGRFPSGRL
jgi:hypothetical protein